ncbi:phytoene desaturase family protein [Tomitella gaofuii]|uniref:phytoene desaturase family protein n=1 Tax=Tomitella gaofuii TaxID=2760083 RepID=UPI0015FA7CEA|nr:NAD(P)/FAD-dependent oxidoreductase [Tomitella gaofuii]
MPQHDAIVVGAGHNGLTCACYLAKAGLRVLVVEASPTIGGMTTTRELVLPGFRTDVHASGYQLANLSSAPDELELRRFGLDLIRPEVSLCKAFPDGTCVSIHDSVDRTCADIARASVRDAEAWRALYRGYLDGKDALRQELESAPRPWAEMLAEDLRGSRAGERIRFRFQSVRTWAEENFESESMRILLADFAGHAGFAPDDAGGAAFAFLFLAVIQDVGNRAVEGGMGRLAESLAACLAQHGGRIRTGAMVTRIRVGDGKAVGVDLADGTFLPAGVIASSVHPRRLILELLADADLGRTLITDAEHYEVGAAQMGIYVALSEPVHYSAGATASSATQVHLMPPTIDSLADAFRTARADRLPDEPSAFVVNEAAIDPGRVPEGRSALKVVLTTVPFDVDWPRLGAGYARSVLRSITERYIPDLEDKILAVSVMTPPDYEADVSSAVHGTVTHGAMTVYQQGALRPVPELGQYKGPVSGLYLCGAGSHPGPGVSMMPGRNAAHVILAEL